MSDQLLQALTPRSRLLRSDIVPVAGPDYTSVAIRSVTLSNPVRVETNGNHPFQSGDQLYISGITGADELNGNTYPVTVDSPASFLLTGTDGAGIGSYLGGGVAVRGRLMKAEAGQLDANYVHIQSVPAEVWTVNHSLGKYPAVTVIDSAGGVVWPDIQHLSMDQLLIVSGSAYAGTAVCN